MQVLASMLLLLAFSSIVLESHSPGPLLMGLCVTGILLALDSNAGCAMNPALDLGCRAVAAAWRGNITPFTVGHNYWSVNPLQRWAN